MSKEKNNCMNEKQDFYFDKSTQIKLGRFYWKLKRSKIDFIVYAPRTIKLFSEGVKYVFKNPKILGMGGFGAVFAYRDQVHGLEIVLKVEGGKQAESLGNRTVEPTEKYISEVLNEEKSCNVIRSRYIESRGPKYRRDHYYIMEKYSGNCLNILRKLFHDDEQSEKEKIKIWLQIVENARKQIVCLAKLGFYYTDIKPENILYCDNGTNFSYHLGDLGATMPDPYTLQHYSPYSPPEYKGNNIKIIDKGKIHLGRAISCIIFLLGMLTLQIMDDYRKERFVSDFYHGYIYEMDEDPSSFTEKKYNALLKNFLDKTAFSKSQKAVIKKLLCYNPKTRLEKVDINKPFFELKK